MILYSIREAGHSFRSGRLRSTMAVTTIAIAMLIFLGFLVLSHNLHLGLDRFRAATRLEVVLADGADPIAISATIQGLPGVSSAKYYSKADALEYFRKAHGEELARGIVEGLGGSPFPAFIEVGIASSEVDPSALAERIGKLRGVAESYYGAESLRRIGAVAETVGTASWVVGGIMAFFILLIVVNGVRATVHARASEIRILRLIGASDGTLRAPFVVEGAAAGLLGALLGLGIVFASIVLARDRISFFPIEFLPPLDAAATLLFAVALGALGGVIAVREAAVEGETEE
jgi:cell division transport system permease protein